MTHTYSILAVSKKTYEEIRVWLELAGYNHAFHDGVIDMHGIALSLEEEEDASLPEEEEDGNTDTGTAD